MEEALAQTNSKSKSSSEKQKELLQVVEGSLRQLVAISVDNTIQVVSTWFEDKMERFIQDLSQHPRIQYDYLTKYVAANEEKISNSINNITLDSKEAKISAQYKQFLILQTRLLCQFNPKNVAHFVKKEYYPIKECLEIVKEQGILSAEAVLAKRNGEFLKAIDIYMRILALETDIGMM